MDKCIFLLKYILEKEITLKLSLIVFAAVHRKPLSDPFQRVPGGLDPGGAGHGQTGAGVPGPGRSARPAQQGCRYKQPIFNISGIHTTGLRTKITGPDQEPR